MPAKKLPELIDTQAAELRNIRNIEALIAAAVQAELAARGVTPKSSSAQIAPPAQPPRAIVDEMLESLWNSIHVLNGTVDQITNKLDPVLLSDAENGSGSSATPAPNRGPLGNNLASMRDQVDGTNRRLTDILARLTL